MLENFNKTIFSLALAVFALLTFLALVAAAAVEEGTAGETIFADFLAQLFYVLRFPTHTLLFPLINLGGAFTFFAGLIINCMFYALLTERLYHFAFMKNNNV